MSADTPRLFGDAGAPYNCPSSGFQSIHIVIPKSGAKSPKKPLGFWLNTLLGLQQPPLVQTFDRLFFSPFRTVSFQSMVDYHVRPLGGVLYVNEPDNMRDARLWYHASKVVAAAALTSRVGGAAVFCFLLIHSTVVLPPS